MKKTLVAAFALCMSAPVAVLEAQQGLGRDETTWTWSGPLSAGQWARGHSVNGGITFEPSPDNQIHVRAEKRWRRGDPRDVSFGVVRARDGITICVMRHGLDTCDEDGLHSRRSRARRSRGRDDDASADITIQVPRGVHVKAATVNGGVKVEGTSGEVQASTVNGGVNVSTSGGPVSATTVNGSVRAEVGSAAREEMHFRTVNGSVEVRLPSDIRADVDISTVNGGINTDFPITVTGRWGPRRATGTINGGGEKISINTVNGSVRLRTS